MHVSKNNYTRSLEEEELDIDEEEDEDDLNQLCDSAGQLLSETCLSSETPNTATKTTTKTTPEQFIEKAIKVHGDKYDYSKVEYVNSRTKIIIICKTHGEFKQDPHSHLKGYNCYKCGRINASNKVKNKNNLKKHTNIRVQKEIIEKYKDDIDFQTIDKKLKNTDKLQCICKICTYNWTQQIANIYNRGLKCPNCNENKRVIWDNNSVSQLIINNNKFNEKIDFRLNIPLNIKGCRSILLCICKICNYGIGNEWQTEVQNLYNKKRGCPACACNQKLSLDDCRQTALEKEGKCLSEIYTNKETIMVWECKEGHTWSTKYGSIRGGTWCSNCVGNKKFTIEVCLEYAKERGGYCLEETYNNVFTQMKWGCNNGHTFYKSFNGIKKNKSWCGQCNKCPSCGFYKTGGELCDETCSGAAIKKYRQKSKEWSVVRFLQEKLPDENFIHNESVGSHCTKNDRENTNGHLFPDIRFDCGFYHLIVEVDENKHRGADYTCDERRMYDIITKLGMPCIFIRYNPDSKESTKEILLKNIEKYLELDIEGDKVWDDYGFKVEYLFYV